MTPNEYHSQAAHLREHGEAEHALALYEQAQDEYSRERNWEGVARVLLEKAIVFLHQFEQAEQSSFLAQALIALRQANTVIEDTRLSPELMALWALGTGNALAKRQEWVTAANHYALAAELSPNTWEHANIAVHEAYARAKAGDPAAPAELAQAIKQLEEQPLEDTVLKRTWLSGALLKQAELLHATSPAEAAQVLSRAEAVIHEEPVLVVRQRQLEQAKNAFGL